MDSGGPNHIYRVTEDNIVSIIQQTDWTIDEMIELWNEAKNRGSTLFIHLVKTTDYRRPSGYRLYTKFIPNELLNESMLEFIFTKEAWDDEH